MPVIDINVQSGAWPETDEIDRLVGRAIKATVAMADLKYPPQAELSVVLSDDDHIRQLNCQWRHIDRPTNVLSFPSQALKPEEMAGQLLGDIVLARKTLEREANEQNKTFSNHLTHLVIHGFLHIFGYDHENDSDADIMEKLETRCLAELGIADPYAALSDPPLPNRTDPD